MKERTDKKQQPLRPPLKKKPPIAPVLSTKALNARMLKNFGPNERYPYGIAFEDNATGNVAYERYETAKERDSRLINARRSSQYTVTPVEWAGLKA